MLSQASASRSTVLAKQTVQDVSVVNQTSSAAALTGADFDARIGEVQATPTAYTVLGRLKDIFDRLLKLTTLTFNGSNALTVDGSAVTQPVSATNLDVALSTRLKPADTLAKVSVVDTITNPVSSKTAITASAPTASSVGVASAQAVASNSNRKGLVLTNTSANYISLAFGANAAVLYSGITLNPGGGVFVMDEYLYTTAAVNAIASGAASNLGIQEFV